MNAVCCSDCQKFSLKRVKVEDAKKGMGHCAYREPFIRHNALTARDCDKFIIADRDTIEDRRAWLRQQENSCE